MFNKKQNSNLEIENLKESYEKEIKLKESDIDGLLKKQKELEEKIKNLEKLAQEKDFTIKEKEIEKKEIEKKLFNPILFDKGHQTLLGFMRVPPFLDKVLGRPFMITLAQEFNYVEAEDRENLEKRKKGVEDLEKAGGRILHTFRDEYKKNHSFRVVYAYSSKEYKMNTPNGKVSLKDFMFPKDLNAGVEISSQFKSALYLCLKNKTTQSAVLPESVFGAPFLSYAFPILDDSGTPIGAVSFSNDISQIIQIAQSLGDIVSAESDTVLHNLATVLKEELHFSEEASYQVKEEALLSQKNAENIRRKGQEVIEIAERLKVLSLNTAIEATRVGAAGKGVSVIADQMKMISETTRKTLKEIYQESQKLHDSSKKVFHTSSKLEESSNRLKSESSILFNTSFKITSQKDDLAALVRMTIDEITQDQEDLNAIFELIKKIQHEAGKKK
ncbi:MAG TPA: hypothetical protein DHW82_04355 [Spirochaetia bacterium]|nr:MAG: hypothetical protein A2Y41_02060 [Spirochaetes bacterium GWB1_36_13]HCL56226.1 hypothetical protein [Spirochaetia bacterium]